LHKSQQFRFSGGEFWLHVLAGAVGRTPSAAVPFRRCSVKVIGKLKYKGHHTL